MSDSTREAFDTTNPLLNLSLELTILIGIFISTAVVFLLMHLISNMACRNEIKKLHRRLYPSALIRFGLEEYITITIVVLIKLYALDFSNWFESVSSIFALIAASFIALVPIMIWIFLYKNHDKVLESKFKKKYDTLFDGLQHRSKSAMLYCVNFTLRRISLALLIVVVPRYNWLQT